MNERGLTIETTPLRLTEIEVWFIRDLRRVTNGKVAVEIHNGKAIKVITTVNTMVKDITT